MNYFLFRIFIYGDLPSFFKNINIKSQNMEDGDSKSNVEKNFHGKHVGKISNVRDVFQPFWIRHSSVLSLIVDGEFVERKFNFIWIVGIVFWICLLISKIF